MAQTTGSIWVGAGTLELSTNGSSWTDISGASSSVRPPTLNRRSGQAYTLDGEYPIVKVGKWNLVETAIRVIYTEGAGEAFELFRAQFESAGGGTVYIRWSPAGGDAGDFLFTTDVGRVINFTYPAVDAEEDGPHVVELTIAHAQVTKSVVAS